MKTYSELSKLPTFEERFRYLQLSGSVGAETFGFERYLNQRFYASVEWKKIRDKVILRDNGCDLGITDRLIGGKIIIHHMNPVSREDILTQSELLLDIKYLVCVSQTTHNAIHYGDENLLIPSTVVERKPGDTCLWKN